MAGLMLAGHAGAVALVAPMNGRAVDKHRPARVVLTRAALQFPAYVGLLAAIVGGLPTPLLIAGAICVGAATPPSSAVIFASWPRLVPSDQLHTAYALDSVSNEVTFISGPLLVAAVVSVAQPTVAVGLAGLCTSLGAVLLARTPVVRAAPRPAASAGTASRRGLGPLAVGQVRVVISIASLGAFCYGAMQVGAAAWATHFAAAGSAGIALSVLSAGGAVGGLVYGGRSWRLSLRRQLALLYGVCGAVLLAACLASSLASLIAVYACFGLLTGPSAAAEQLILNNASPTQYRAETFAWLNSFMWVGYGLGVASTGRLVGATHSTGAFMSAATAALVATTLGSALLRPVRSPASSQEVATIANG
jgi:MFS family permease